MEDRRFLSRTGTLLLLGGGLLILFFVVLYELQIVSGAEYAAKATKQIARTETVEASRGGIYDRYGRVLVSNKLSYRVKLDTSLMGDDEQINETLLALLDLCRKHGVEWEDTMPVERSAPYRYTLTAAGETARTRLRKLCQTMKWIDPVQEEVLKQIEAGTAALLEEEPAAGTLVEAGTVITAHYKNYDDVSN